MSTNTITPLPIFAYITIRPCGCVCQAAGQECIEEWIQDEGLHGALSRGCKFRAVSEPEYRSLPWKCPACENIDCGDENDD